MEKMPRDLQEQKITSGYSEESWERLYNLVPKKKTKILNDRYSQEYWSYLASTAPQRKEVK